MDAESKKQAIEKLNAEHKEHAMEIDEPVKKRKSTVKAKKLKKKAVNTMDQMEH